MKTLKTKKSWKSFLEDIKCIFKTERYPAVEFLLALKMSFTAKTSWNWNQIVNLFVQR